MSRKQTGACIRGSASPLSAATGAEAGFVFAFGVGVAVAVAFAAVAAAASDGRRQGSGGASER